MSDPSRQAANTSEAGDLEGLTSRLAERFGGDFVGLVRQMGLVKEEHLRELLDAPSDEQQELAMAWMRAATLLEAEWEGHARRQGGQEMALARYLEIRLPSPRRALEAQRYAQQQKASTQASAEAPPPSPRERESAQRRIRLEAAIAEAREAIRRVDAIDRLESADRQAIVQQLEELISVISRRLNP
ncbi:MAG: hypothetical protein K1X87_11320 [Dehalococcoidia bacterium]|nr:hypothetical protein [Dehalococcoidia bacterium]